MRTLIQILIFTIAGYLVFQIGSCANEYGNKIIHAKAILHDQDGIQLTDIDAFCRIYRIDADDIVTSPALHKALIRFAGTGEIGQHVVREQRGKVSVDVVVPGN